MHGRRKWQIIFYITFIYIIVIFNSFFFTSESKNGNKKSSKTETEFQQKRVMTKKAVKIRTKRPSNNFLFSLRHSWFQVLNERVLIVQRFFRVNLLFKYFKKQIFFSFEPKIVGYSLPQRKGEHTKSQRGLLNLSIRWERESQFTASKYLICLVFNYRLVRCHFTRIRLFATFVE